MPVNVLYPEARQQPDHLEHEVFGADVNIVKRDTGALSELSDADCAAADGLMILGFPVAGADLVRFPKLRAIVRMGVGYDKLDRPAAAERNILICNVPDYGTTEVADHAIALALTLRRGILLHHEYQRHDPPALFRSFQHPLIQRLGMQTFGIIGLGRIGTAAAVRAKSLGMDVVFQDPYKPDGYDKSLGIRRVETLSELLSQAFVVSVHCPRTTETNGLIGAKEIAQMPMGSFLINTARGAIVDTSAIPEAIASGRLAGAAIDVLATEPPSEDDPLIRAWRDPAHPAHDRLIVNPHAAFYSEEGLMDMRTKGADACRRALLGLPLRNVVNR